MRKILLFIAILAPGLSGAQISSRITSQDQLPDHIRFNPLGQQPEGVLQVPKVNVFGGATNLTVQQAKLASEQTKVIKDLTARVGELEKRVESLEESRKKGGAK